MINDGNFGKFSIQTGLILRDTNFTRKVLLNSEMWHSLTKLQVENLEVIDRRLFRKIFNAHSKTSLEWLYLDSGKLDLSSLIKIRRLMYLWEILNHEKAELINRIYSAQKVSNNVGDWVRLVDTDRSELRLGLSDTQIQGVSKFSFKTFVKKKVTQYFLQNLEAQKSKHSKSKYLSCTKLKMAEYIKCTALSTREKQLLFKLRSRTLDVKQNFPGQHGNPWCSSCFLFQETQGHLLQCPKLVTKLKYLNLNFSKLNENFVYGNISQQQMMVNIYSAVLEVREKLKQDESSNPPLVDEGPMHLANQSQCCNIIVNCNDVLE